MVRKIDTIADLTRRPIICRNVTGVVKAVCENGTVLQQIEYKNTEDRKKKIKILKSTWELRLVYVQICPGIKKEISCGTEEVNNAGSNPSV